MVILDWKDLTFTLLNFEILKLLDFSVISVTGCARNWHFGDILPMKGTLFDFFVHILITKMWSYSVFLPEHDMWLHDRKQLMPICRLLIIRYDFKGHQTVEGSNSANSADHSTTSCLFFHSFNTHFLPASLPLPAGGIKAHYLPTGRKDDKNWSHCVTMTSDFTRSPTSSC